MNIQRAGGGCHRLDLALVEVQVVQWVALGAFMTPCANLLPAANQGMLCLQISTSPFLSFVLQVDLQFDQLTLWSCE